MRMIILAAALAVTACSTTEAQPSAVPVPESKPTAEADSSQLEDAAGRVLDRAQRTATGMAGSAATRSAGTATGNPYVNGMAGSVVRGVTGEVQRWLRSSP